ncbi:MAG: SDR family NAD(P)-dependent oxidoreductase [Deltaproteobacteria bacterium]|nr:SDR family NAD(P)-dependent oxidoreductase [Deltaproteobacteria bacterium]
MNLKGKTVLITGAARRLGRALAERFASKGSNVLIHYGKSRREALALVSNLRNRSVESDAYQAELSDLKSIARMVRKIRRDGYSIDILINNASIFYPAPFGRVKEGDWDAFLDINLKAPFFLIQSIAPLMRRGGRIINIGDRGGGRPDKNFLPYSISKAALIALTEGLAKILPPKIQIFAVCPGPILPASYLGKGRQKKVMGRMSKKWWGTVEDFVKAVFLNVSNL